MTPRKGRSIRSINKTFFESAGGRKELRTAPPINIAREEACRRFVLSRRLREREYCVYVLGTRVNGFLRFLIFTLVSGVGYRIFTCVLYF